VHRVHIIKILAGHPKTGLGPTIAKKTLGMKDFGRQPRIVVKISISFFATLESAVFR